METQEQEQQHKFPCEGLVRLQEQHKMFEWWQNTQNGTLKGIKASVDALDSKLDDKLDALAARIDAKSEAAKAPASETATWIRNALWATVLFGVGFLANKIVF